MVNKKVSGWREFFGEKRREGFDATQISALWKEKKEGTKEREEKVSKVLDTFKSLKEKESKTVSSNKSEEPNKTNNKKDDKKDDSSESSNWSESPPVVKAKPKPKSSWEAKKVAFVESSNALIEKSKKIKEPTVEEPKEQTQAPAKSDRLKAKNKMLKQLVRNFLDSSDSE